MFESLRIKSVGKVCGSVLGAFAQVYEYNPICQKIKYKNSYPIPDIFSLLLCFARIMHLIYLYIKNFQIQNYIFETTKN